MTLDSRMPNDEDPVVRQICELCPEAADEVLNPINWPSCLPKQ